MKTFGGTTTTCIAHNGKYYLKFWHVNTSSSSRANVIVLSSLFRCVCSHRDISVAQPVNSNTMLYITTWCTQWMCPTSFSLYLLCGVPSSPRCSLKKETLRGVMKFQLVSLSLQFCMYDAHFSAYLVFSSILCLTWLQNEFRYLMGKYWIAC